MSLATTAVIVGEVELTYPPLEDLEERTREYEAAVLALVPTGYRLSKMVDHNALGPCLREDLSGPCWREEVAFEAEEIEPQVWQGSD